MNKLIQQKRAANVLTPQDKDTALRIARHALTSWVTGRGVPSAVSVEKEFSPGPALHELCGVFVTLLTRKPHSDHKELRGCIGTIRGIVPAFEGILKNTVSACSRDPRFRPLRTSELPSVTIEISLLSPFVVCRAEEIAVGRDGLYVKKGGLSGLLLPQVAAEHGWDRTKFLEQACLKAELDKDDWKCPGVVIQRFTAQVFSEM